MYKGHPTHFINASQAEKQIDPFVYSVARILGVSVPWNDLMPNDVLNKSFEIACKQKLREQQERLIAYSWETNPERMGR